MTDEKITTAGSLSYDGFCERLSSPAGAELMYSRDVLGRAGLEVLWLKLSLLAEIINISRTARINLRSCRVKLASTTPHLPGFWNFSVESAPATTDAPVQAVLYELGLCWFRTLLTNSGQTPAAVDTLIASLLVVSAGNSELLIESAMRLPALQSTQLLVVKEPSPANAIPAELWQRVLQIGLKMATQIPKFSYSSQAEDALNTVLDRVLTDAEALRVRVATVLFIDPPRMEQDLGELLNELIRDPRWLDSLSAGGTAPTAAAAPAPRPAPAPVAATAYTEEQNMESTIIFKRGSPLPAASASMQPAPAASPARMAPSPAPAAEENLEATIIISKDKNRST